MKNQWIDKHEQPKQRKITKQFLIDWTVSDAINNWLHKKGDDVHRYGIFLDRCDIYDVIKEAKKSADEIIEKHKGQGLDF